jgi:hypothetical protein
MLSGCGVRPALKSEFGSDFEPRSVVPGVVISTQAVAQTAPDRIELEPAGNQRPKLTAQAATALCGCTGAHKPNRIILARLGTELGSLAGQLTWVMEYDNATECTPSLGPPLPSGESYPTGPCTQYEMVNAVNGDVGGVLQIGW